MPDDIQANVDDTVELKCRASGDPVPSIQWRKEEGRIPFGRYESLYFRTYIRFAVVEREAIVSKHV